MKTGIITTDTYLNHNTGQGHPERADRVTVVIDNLKKIKSKNLIWKKPTKFDLIYFFRMGQFVNKCDYSLDDFHFWYIILKRITNDT